ncbi:MAG: alpha/beta fold hydrolase [Burkholderiales bacterium]|nr:alpha/beta fold hydrolase [Burkholderiales bacterium]
MNKLNTQMPQNATQIFINGRVGKLDCMLLNSLLQETRGIAIIFHPDPKGGGTNTNKIVQTIAKTLCLNGYICVCPNLRGVGQSDGLHDMGHAEVDDAMAVLDYLQQNYPNLPLVLGGFSFGSSIAAQLAKKTEYQKLILIGMAVTKYQVPVSDISKTIAIHGENDEIVPPELVKQWAIDNDIPVIWYPNTGHFFHGKLVQLQNMLNNFRF